MRILLPVDGSVHSKNALKFLAGRETLLGGSPSIELLNVQYLIPQTIVDMLGLEAVSAYYQTEGRKVFESLADDIKASGLDVTEKILDGEYGHTIAAEADRIDADLIVMGARGLNPVKGLLLGTVSNKVLSSTKRPLLLIRRNPPVTSDRLRVGICVDNSDYGRAAAEFVANFREFFGKDPKISVVHVTPDFQTLLASDTTDMAVPISSEEDVKLAEKDDYEQSVTPVLDTFREAGIEVETVLLRGEPSEAISEYAKDNLDLIVMGSHGYGNFKSAVMGSTAMHIAASCTLPLLIIRA